MCKHMRRRKMSRERYKKLRITQMTIGFVLIVLSVIILVLTANGTTMETRDATAVLFTLPLGLWFVFSRHILIIH